ncbi:DNA alkylation repair protein [Nocardioides sp. JQ2195]|uniref:DNA alkylation repair protein n=1 Tax=Nocardioides sp. JQ2195 TaxID=2592334 RepID=UPI00143E23E7|nr:DNA alkylation repair protein [Nocardioides sp. JQ2195]QIX28257.1 DNA alkylation repair protein [Nocardioides sp. JQ2195]
MPEEIGPHELASLVRQGIAGAAEPTRAASMRAYMKSTMPYRGVSAVPLARLLKETYAAWVLPDEESWREAVLLLWDGAEFREERYAATSLAGHRLYREHQQVHTLELYRHLVETGAWWDHVDGIASHLVRDILVAHRDEVTGLMREWAVDDHLWTRRTAIICQLGLKDRLDRVLLTHAIDANLDGSTRTRAAESPHGREFFIRKAIGWALRDHFRTDPDWVRGFVAARGTRLSGLSRREALKHDLA